MNKVFTVIFAVLMFAFGLMGVIRKVPEIKVEDQNASTSEVIKGDFKREVFLFKNGKDFKKELLVFIKKLETEKELVFIPSSNNEMYIHRIIVNDIDKENFSLMVFMSYEDSNGKPMLIPSKFIVDKKSGSPKEEFFEHPETGEWIKVAMADNTNALSIYDAGLFGAVRDRVQN
ncbi:hypothetical protein [Endozoicomonas sp. SESOKO1]|uniref:hypothetical protein n=1 Tax=Endozoicomonas sp. SESOKO1 TaxID=2828742 RepID=UPI0021472741|nr:hypothetical protein [Endozoicomonas sp. SESOKO1]